jgi:hypothetical protein
MPARHVSRAPARRSSNRRKLVWAVKNVTFTATAAGNVSNVDLLTDLKVAGASILGCTIMRTHLQISVTNTVAAGNDFTWGLIVGENANVVTNTADTALIPDPTNNPELDWMWWEHAVAAPVYDPGGTNILIRDVKAKRKLQELNQTYMWSLIGGAGAAALTGQLAVRTLIALP